ERCGSGPLAEAPENAADEPAAAAAMTAECNEAKRLGELADNLASAATGFIADHIGYSSRREALYARMGIDPYTKNTELIDSLNEVARIETGLGFALNFVPLGYEIPGLGIVSDINRYHGYLN